MDQKTQPSSRWIMWVAIIVGVGGTLFGYDIGVVSGALLFIRHAIAMTDTQLGVVVGAVLAGSLFGTLLAGPLADKYGRRTLILIASVIFAIGVICILLAKTFIALVLARLFLGVGAGIVIVTVPLFVTEIVPANKRGRYVTFFQLFLTFGIVFAYFIDTLFTPTGNWRAMFAVALVPALLLFVGMWFLPDTPRWLLSKGRESCARAILKRTHQASSIDAAMAKIQQGLAMTQGGWGELFSMRMLFPLLVAVGIAVLNQWTGINTFLQYAPNILKSAGIHSDSVAMMGSVGIGLLNFICTIVATILIDRVGRRPLLLVGCMGVVVFEVYLGVVNLMGLSQATTGWLSMLGLFGFIVFYAIGPGVVVWLAMSELFPTRIRGKGIAVCLFFNSMAGTVLASLFLDIEHAFGVAATYLFCAIASLGYFLLVKCCLPETASKPLEDIQDYFAKRQAASERGLSTELQQ